MRFPLNESDIDQATDVMLRQLGHSETDDDARKDIRQWISMANAMYEKGFLDGVRACYKTEPDEK